MRGIQVQKSQIKPNTMKTLEELKSALLGGKTIATRLGVISMYRPSTYEEGTNSVAIQYKTASSFHSPKMTPLSAIFIKEETSEDRMKTREEIEKNSAAGLYSNEHGRWDKLLDKLMDFIFDGMDVKVHYLIHREIDTEKEVDFYSLDYSVERRLDSLLRKYEVTRSDIDVSFEGKVEQIRDEDLEAASNWYNKLKEKNDENN